GIVTGTSHSGEFITPAQIIGFPGLLAPRGTIQAPAGTLVGNGDLITILAWNSSHYGTNQGNLAGTTIIDAQMNLTRAPEPNVTIIAPDDNTSRDGLLPFNITANITVLINDGTCNATLTLGNTSILNVATGETLTHDLGLVLAGTTVQTSFLVIGEAIGTTNATITASCLPEGPIISARTSDTLSNITITDESGPLIALMQPANNTLNRTGQTITFRYNVTDLSAISNCSLIIDQDINTTDETITKDIEQTLTAQLANGQHNWSIQCTDALGQNATSVTYNITIAFYPPSVLALNITSPVILNAGTPQISRVQRKHHGQRRIHDPAKRIRHAYILPEPELRP
ncbi:MAG: hypothetical protein HC945_04255, partial [Nitrosarchaeum sp.]|nr:hypothetical protein [Nitrosarchaeum sp.]